MSVSKDELAQALNQLLLKIEETGLKLNLHENRHDFLNRVAQNIITFLPNLHRSQLQDSKFLKACAVSLFTEVLNRQKGLDFDYAQLFNENIVLEQKEVFKRIFTTLLKYSHPELSKKAAEDVVDDLTEKLANAAQENFANDTSVMMKDNDAIINIMSNLLTLSMITLFGIDPNKGVGQVIKPVLGIQGNLFAIPTVSPGEPQADAFMQRIQTENWLDGLLKSFGVYLSPTPLSMSEPPPPT